MGRVLQRIGGNMDSDIVKEIVEHINSQRSIKAELGTIDVLIGVLERLKDEILKPLLDDLL